MHRRRCRCSNSNDKESDEEQHWADACAARRGQRDGDDDGETYPDVDSVGPNEGNANDTPSEFDVDLDVGYLSEELGDLIPDCMVAMLKEDNDGGNTDGGDTSKADVDTYPTHQGLPNLQLQTGGLVLTADRPLSRDNQRCCSVLVYDSTTATRFLGASQAPAEITWRL